MGLIINTVLTTKDGGTVASGAYVQFETNFPAGETTYNVSMNVWRSEVDKNNGMQQLRGFVEIPQLNFNNELTEADFDSLTPSLMNTYVKNYLEGFIGADTVTIV